MRDKQKLTKAETTALWHAIQFMTDCVRVMPGMSCTAEQIEVERERLLVAKRALRKVNKLRKQGL